MRWTEQHNEKYIFEYNLLLHFLLCPKEEPGIYFYVLDKTQSVGQLSTVFSLFFHEVMNVKTQEQELSKAILFIHTSVAALYGRKSEKFKVQLNII